MANVNAAVEQMAEAGLTSRNGFKLGWLASTTKAAQNDTITITNAAKVTFAQLQIASTGVADTATVATNVITCTGATAGPVFGFVLYQ